MNISTQAGKSDDSPEGWTGAGSRSIISDDLLLAKLKLKMHEVNAVKIIKQSMVNVKSGHCHGFEACWQKRQVKQDIAVGGSRLVAQAEIGQSRWG